METYFKKIGNEHLNKMSAEFRTLASRYTEAGFKHGLDWVSRVELKHLLEVVNYIRNWKEYPDTYKYISDVIRDIDEYLNGEDDPKLMWLDRTSREKHDDVPDIREYDGPITALIDGIPCISTLATFWFTGWAQACLYVVNRISPSRDEIWTSIRDDHSLWSTPNGYQFD